MHQPIAATPRPLVRRPTLIALLNRYFDAMLATTEEFGGTGVKFLGDGLIVLHGPNRTGKSSLAEALRCCLFDVDHRLQHLEPLTIEVRSVPDQPPGREQLLVFFF